MADILTPEKRSWNMSRIKGRDTKPEMRVRSFLHQAGLRFRLHYKSLPGKPDVVLSKYRTCIFIHGCYWHRHPKCKYAYEPKSRVDFWQKKFKENVDRDKRNKRDLRKAGWKVIVIWECQTAEENNLKKIVNSMVKL